MHGHARTFTDVHGRGGRMDGGIVKRSPALYLVPRVYAAAVADRRYRGFADFTIHLGAIVAWYWKRRLRTVRMIFWSKNGGRSLRKAL